MEKEQATPGKEKNTIIKMMGVILFVAVLFSTYAHFPVDHPWWFDLGGVLISGLMVTKPDVLVDILKAILKRFQ